jgi:hypothetical protein
MEIIKNYKKSVLLVVGLALSIASCKKDEQKVPAKEVPIDLPSTLSLTFGEQQDIPLPADLLKYADAQIRLEFTETENLQITGDSKLRDKLTKAVTVDKTAGKIHINSALLYPNGAISSSNGVKLPESYKVTVFVSSSSESFTGKQTLELKVAPTRLKIKGLDNTAAIPFAYVLYGDAAGFELEAPASLLEGTSWVLQNQSALGTVVSFKSNQLQFSSTAGDPKKKAEQAYDLIPTLQKDGFTIASQQFRVVFIPKIKFFYGTYYSDLDLTILLNNLHIALSNGYISAPPTLYPEKYKSTFSISAIEKGGVPVDNKEGIFAIDTATGAITVRKNAVLTAGAYKLTVLAITTTGLEFSTTLTLNMSSAD